MPRPCRGPRPRPARLKAGGNRARGGLRWLFRRCSRTLMLLTITSTSPPATDLGFLLHKNPDAVRSVEAGYLTAHVFYPEAEPARCTAALWCEVDPVALVRR